MATITIPLDPSVCAAIVESIRWSGKVVRTESDCLQWTGAKTANGYPIIGVGKRMRLAHRVALIASLGRDLTPGLTVDHLCRNRGCVNPQHLEEVTLQVNVARARALITHCPEGHEYSEGNLKPSELLRGWRGCLTCSRERARARRAKARAAA